MFRQIGQFKVTEFQKRPNKIQDPFLVMKMSAFQIKIFVSTRFFNNNDFKLIHVLFSTSDVRHQPQAHSFYFQGDILCV